jgi:protein-tyrosine phosphatase
MSKVSVLFVCLGNICRSPTAHGVFQGMVDGSGLADAIEVDSAGTGDWHIGHSPDQRTSQVAATKGYDLNQLRARLVSADDFEQFDYIIAMDRANLSDLKVIAKFPIPTMVARMDLSWCLISSKRLLGVFCSIFRPIIR